MAKGQLVENRGVGPEGASPDLGGLFHTEGFHRLHAAGRGSFLKWQVGDTVVASIHLTEIDTGHWRSPARGTFAGFATAPHLKLAELAAFQAAVEEHLRRRGARMIELLLPPMAHSPAALAAQIHALHAAGFAISRCDLNQSLLVDSEPLVNRMSPGNRKRLAKCARDAYRCERVDLAELPEVYQVIADNRTAKGHAMSMTLVQLEQMNVACPDRLHLFACRAGSDDGLVAAAVCLLVEPELLYVFYWGDRPGHAGHSPVVTVADAIYRHCQALGIRLLDVGVSTVDREANHGLLDFKHGLGFVDSLKLTMSKRL